MRLKLRGKKNLHGQKVWSIYAVDHAFGTRREKLYKSLGPVPKALAVKIFEQSKISTVCNEENIRQNVDVPFEQVCDEYLERKCRPPHKVQATYKMNVVTFRPIKRVMQKVFDKFQPYRTNKTIWIHAVTIPVLDGYKVTRKEEGVSNRTINIELNLIRCAIKYALEANYLIRFPLLQFKNLPEEQPKRAWCEDIAEIDRLIAAVDCPQTKLKLKLGFEAGLRRSEILRLKLENIDLERRLFTVYGEKENRFKEIPIGEEMATLLNPLMTMRYEKDGYKLHPRTGHQKVYLFCHENGEPFKSFGTGWYKAKKTAGITRKLGPHSMRHTFASHLLQGGANPVDVSKMLGHAKVSTTLDIYGHSSREGRLKAFEKLPYLRRAPAQVIPLRKVVNGPDFSERGSKWGVNPNGGSAENVFNYLKFFGAGGGNRTLTLSLGS
ncbi:MAG: tyrosine-type recombinase/integrase [Deltaproteobacteria bacterium]|nr:tyrosine-type recombinase/integrase [Deltaproteobacteria bacterium]